MTPEEVINTAHIHLESATFRVHVKHSDAYNTVDMEADKPDYVMFVSKSHDWLQKKHSLLVEVVGGEWDLSEMASWIKKHENQNK